MFVVSHQGCRNFPTAFFVETRFNLVKIVKNEPVCKPCEAHMLNSSTFGMIFLVHCFL
jgi:hypothetical protein